MSRYKGRSNTKAIERDFPHIVEMAVPEGGFGKQLDAMHEWHRSQSIQPHNFHTALWTRSLVSAKFDSRYVQPSKNAGD